MRKISIVIIISIFFSIPFNLVSEEMNVASAEEVSEADVFAGTEILEIKNVPLTTKSVLVIDAKTGKIIFSKNPKEILPIASVTKIMSLIIFIESKTKLDKVVSVEESDYKDLKKYINEGDSIAYVPFLAGDKIKVKDAVYAGLIRSANNAVKIFTRATEIREEEFVRRMNERAWILGLRDTHFTETTGLDSANVSTAYDVANLANYAFKNPFIRGVTMTRKYGFSTLNTKKYRQVENTNWLLNMFNPNYYQILGGKTGYLGEVGYNVVAKARDWRGKELIIVVLGAETSEKRFSEAKNLIIEGFGKIK